ncbi:MAG TPA: NADH-quinone oxidoreductase subunit J [Acidimicrobiales bacterium]|jgi:NADH-quinone oxidoreductase subunit J|nr:NADH-quinone oxidoreductase subunit J [Acidimicrobiales bacterium]
MVEQIVFIIGALICLLGASGVIGFRNPVHSALSLIATLFGVAVLFIALEAEFLAAVQIIVYAGAIVVLFLFVIMLLGVDQTDDVGFEPLKGQRPAAIVAGALLVVGLIAIIVLGAVTGESSANAKVEPLVPNVEQLARSLFTDYLFAFEITSVLLVIAVVGAVSLARHRREAFIDELPHDDIPEPESAPSDEVTA